KSVLRPEGRSGHPSGRAAALFPPRKKVAPLPPRRRIRLASSPRALATPRAAGRFFTREASSAMDDTSRPGPHRPGLSRRDFLRGSGVAAAATALAQAPPELEARQDDKNEAVAAIGPGPVRLTLDVNGKQLTQNVEPRVTLLDALRNQM